MSGGEEITGWSHVEGTKIWQSNVGKNLQTRQLYVNGVRAVRATSNAGIPGNIDKTSYGYITDDTSLQTWGNPSDVEFVYTGDKGTNQRWTESRCGVARIVGRSKSTSIAMKEPCLTNAIQIKYPTRIENAYELLDEPGEWYLNRTSGVLYYIPRPSENMNTATVIVPRLETLVSGTGSQDSPIHNIQFSGITFAYATWLMPSGNDGFVDNQADEILVGSPYSKAQVPANVFFHTAHNVIFQNNVFVHLGAQGLAFDLGSQNNRVIGNVFTDISATAVRVGTTDTPYPVGWLQDTSNQIANNYIHNVATEYHGGVGIFAGYVANTTIAHNEVFDLPYTGISIGWGWQNISSFTNSNQIKNNLVFTFNQVLQDGGGIYSNGIQGSSMATGELIEGNVVHDGRYYGPNPYNNGIYTDDGSRYITIQSNILYNNFHDWGGCMPTGDMVFQNNYWDDQVLSWGCPPYVPSNITIANNTSIGKGTGLPVSVLNNAGIEPGFRAIQNPADVAMNKPASASSEWNADCSVSKANDGSVNANDSCGGWSPLPPTSDPNPWWQVDLGSPFVITTVQLVTRQNCCDNSIARQDFEVRASNDPNFSTYAVLGSQRSTPIPFKATWSVKVIDPNAYRYIRATKHGYFFIAQLRVLAIVF